MAFRQSSYPTWFLFIGLTGFLHAAEPAPDADRKPQFSGIYPHLAYFNERGECGTGAVVPWADRLWVITYGPHLPDRFLGQAVRDRCLVVGGGAAGEHRRHAGQPDDPSRIGPAVHRAVRDRRRTERPRDPLQDHVRPSDGEHAASDRSGEQDLLCDDGGRILRGGRALAGRHRVVPRRQPRSEGARGAAAARLPRQRRLFGTGASRVREQRRGVGRGPAAARRPLGMSGRVGRQGLERRAAEPVLPK